MPRGIYRLNPINPPESDFKKGQYVMFPIPFHVEQLMHERNYIPRFVHMLLKPVAAIAGDHISVSDGGGVFINESFFGAVKRVDRQGLPLPIYKADLIIPENYLFVACEHDLAFDSRYIGLIHISHIQKIAEPMFVFHNKRHNTQYQK
ncbi:MAG: S26 family signal peptidase [Desulfobacterales bacterium]|nr:S26 family signal peptidase [Desulfobacterales bacterium]